MSTSAIRAGRAFVELFADDSALVRTLRRAEAKVVQFGTNIQTIGRRLTTLGLSASIPFAASMKIFSSFDDQMRTVQAVTGATGAEFDKLTEKAKLLGRTTSFTTAQVASGMVELGRAGFAPDEVDTAIAGMLDLARATGTDLATATEIAGNTLRRFNLDANEMTRVSDVLTATANLSAQTLVDLGESLKDSGPLASAYGMTLEELCKTLGALANFGIKGSMAGTTMKNIMTRLADPKIQKQFNELGVSVTKMGKMRNVADILSDVGKAVDGLPTDKKLAVFKDLFGLRAIAGSAKLTVAEFERLNEGIDASAGRARQTSKDMDAGIGGSFRMLWSAIEGVAIAVGEALAPSLQKLTDYFTAATSGLVEYITKNKELIVRSAKIVSIITGIGIGLLTLGGMFIGVGKTIGIIATTIATFAKIALAGISLISGAVNVLTFLIGGIATAFTAVVGGLGIVFSGIATALTAALSGLAVVGTAVFSAVAAAVAALVSPIGLVVIALATLGGVFSTAFRIVRGVVSGVGNLLSGLVSLMSGMGNGLIGVFSTVFETLGSIVSGFGNFFIGAFANVGTAVNWLKEMFGSLCTFATETFGAIAAALGRGDIEAAIQVIWASIKLIWVKGSTSLLSTWYWLTETLQTAWATCVFKIAELLTTAWFGVQEFWTETVYTMSTLWVEFSNGVVSAWKTAEQSIAQGIGSIIAKMQGLDPNEMANIISEDYDRQATQRENEKGKALSAIQQQRDNKMSSLKTEKEGTLNTLQSDFERNSANRRTDYDAKIAAQEAELQSAKNAYNEAINRAKNPVKVEGAEEPESLTDRLKSKVEEVVKGFNANTDLGSKVSVSGSFSAAAIQSMGVGSSMDRVAKATEKSEKHLEKLVNKNDKPEKQAAKKKDEDENTDGDDLAVRELKQQTRFLRDISERGLSSKFA
ncbi:hypothetical protein FACS1894189_0700 [Planctomycetales bacterium]|nr:hypothetical protein FACS1894189_0700 [Planctomycetales bacterium]